MKYFFIMMFFISLICLITGLIFPKALIRWGDDKNKNKKMVGIYFGIPLILFLFFAILTNLDNSTNIQTQNNNTTQQTQTANVETGKTPEKTEKAKPKIYNAGEVGETDKWQVKVLEVREDTTIPANNKYEESFITQEKFVIMKLELKNISTSPIHYDSNDFAMSSEKSVYKIDDVGFKALQKLNSKETVYNKNTNFFSVYDDINPNMTKNTYIAFNVPKDLDISTCALGVITNKNNAIYIKLK